MQEESHEEEAKILEPEQAIIVAPTQKIPTSQKQQVVELDKTPIDVVQILVNFTPAVGEATEKIAVSLRMRLLFSC